MLLLLIFSKTLTLMGDIMIGLNFVQDSADETFIHIYDKYYKVVAIFLYDEECNEHLEQNEFHGVIAEKGGVSVVVNNFDKGVRVI